MQEFRCGRGVANLSRDETAQHSSCVFTVQPPVFALKGLQCFPVERPSLCLWSTARFSVGSEAGHC